jgi:hypothetical protein
MKKLDGYKYISEDLKNMSYAELLKYYDNPKNINIKDCRENNWENSEIKFPSHCLVFLTH